MLEADELKSWSSLQRQASFNDDSRPNSDHLLLVLYVAQFVQIVLKPSQGIIPIGIEALGDTLGKDLPVLHAGCLEELIDLPQQYTAEGDWEFVKNTQAWQPPNYLFRID